MPTVRVAHRVARTGAEGPFDRQALWLQGCSLRCPGCCNPELFDPTAGTAWAVDALVEAMLADAAHTPVEGITLLGGEPLDQIDPVAELCRRIAAAGLGVIVFTGYRRETLASRAGFAALWSAIDTLIDGPFLARAPEPVGGRRFVGSSNQRLLHRTERYAAPELWRGPNRAEIRVGPAGTVSIHGFPAAVAPLALEVAATPRASELDRTPRGGSQAPAELELVGG